MPNFGGYGIIEEGKFKGKKFIIPREVYIEKGKFIGGQEEFSLACLKHEKFIPSNGCDRCQEEQKNNVK